MRPSNKSRSRNNKPGNNGNHQNNSSNQRQRVGNIMNRVFESAGPDGKVRGTPQQIIDKYQALARDAQLSGDRVAAESYLQHSEHYSRLLGEAQRQQMESRPFNQQDRDDGQQPRDDGPQARGYDGQSRGDEGQQPSRGDEGREPRSDDGFEPRRQTAMAVPVASGLAMIDADDGDYPGGPIETPEGRRARVDGPAPVVDLAAVRPQIRPEPQPAPQPKAETVNGPVPVEEPAAAEPPRRPRTRRRPKADAAPDAAADADAAPLAE